MDGGLPGGVAAADDHDVDVLHLPSRGHGTAVEDPEPDQGLDGGHPQPAIGDPRRDDDRPGAQVPPVGVQQVRLTGRPGSSPVTDQPVKKRVPKRIAWFRARCASRIPETPRGKPR